MKSTKLLGIVSLISFIGELQAAGSWPAPLLMPVTNPQAAPLPVVVVRFPMMVMDADKEAMSKDYSDKMFPGGNYGTYTQNEIVPNVAQTMLTKSMYYGLQLGQCLAAKSDGAYHVLLEPATIGRSGGAWQYTSVTRPASATLVVDLMTWSSPYSSMINIGTFGKKFAPFITVRASPAALPTTKGLAYVNENWYFIAQPGAAGGGNQHDARSGNGASLAEFLNTRAKSSALGFVSPWKKLTPQLPAALLNKQPGPYRPGTVTPLPDLFIELARAKAPVDEPENEETCLGTTHMVRSVLGDAAVRAADSQRETDYAQELSTFSSGAFTAENLRQHSDVVTKFLEAELKLLEVQDDKLRQLLLTQDFTAAWAKLREDEISSSRKQNVKNWLAVGVMAVGTGIGMGGDLATMQANTLIAEKMMANTAKTAAAQVSAFSDVYAVLGDYSVEVIVDGEHIQAKSLADLRSSLVGIFKRKYRQ
jgi:hypothetical protein